jgi:hypothetical protein
MKKYLLFAGAAYYPSMGWEDFKNDFDSYDLALEKAKEMNNSHDNCDWYQIVDTETRSAHLIYCDNEIFKSA